MGLFSKPVSAKELRDFKNGRAVREKVAKEAAAKAHRQELIRERKAQDAKDKKAAAASRAKVAKQARTKTARTTNTGKKSSSWW
jgi:hypothetical protein